MTRGNMVRLLSSYEGEFGNRKLPLKRTLQEDYNLDNDFFDNEIAIVIDAKITPSLDMCKIHTTGGKTGWLNRKFLEVIS